MIALTINNRRHKVDVDPDTPLLWVLRDTLDLTGTKYGCGMGLCGACTVLVAGEAVRSCSITAAQASEKSILTIEGLSPDGTHPVQLAWKAEEASQCGYCQSGQIMSAVALLNKHPHPDDHEIDQAMSGNICRCATYQGMRAAIHRASGKRGGHES